NCLHTYTLLEKEEEEEEERLWIVICNALMSILPCLTLGEENCNDAKFIEKRVQLMGKNTSKLTRPGRGASHYS
ncbi:hypothetical protein SK128_021683, partial [Halocaridina rubra]